jgi:hypothetical protein
MSAFLSPPKPWWRSRTVWLGLLELAIGLCDLLADSGLTGGSADGALLAAAGALTVLFRYLTDQPIDRPALRGGCGNGADR